MIIYNENTSRIGQTATMLSRFAKHLIISFSLLSTLSVTFVNDYVLANGVPAFYLCWASVILARMFLLVKYSKVELIAQISLFVVVFPFFLREAWFGNYYANSFIFCILYVNVVFFIPRLVREWEVVGKSIFAIMSVFLVFSLITFLSGRIRADIIFGPNVLYRVYVFLFAIFLLAWKHKKKSQSVIDFSSFYVFLCFGVCIAATGSRGALVVFSITIIYIILHYRFFLGNNNRYIKLASFVVFIMVCTYIVALEYSSLLWRLYYFDASNASEAARISYYESALDYFFRENTDSILAGIRSDKYLAEFGFYPHSIFVESLAYHGLVFLLIVFLCYFSYALFFLKNPNVYYLAFPYIGLYFGALVSGDLLYNYPVLALSFSLVAIFLAGQEKFSLVR